LFANKIGTFGYGSISFTVPQNKQITTKFAGFCGFYSYHKKSINSLFGGFVETTFCPLGMAGLHMYCGLQLRCLWYGYCRRNPGRKIRGSSVLCSLKRTFFNTSYLGVQLRVINGGQISEMCPPPRTQKSIDIANIQSLLGNFSSTVI
jgi:hypothetical protein